MDGLPHLEVTSFEEDEQGFIWIGTGSGIMRYDGYHPISIGQCEAAADDSYQLLKILSLFYDRSGTLWIGTIGQGIYYKKKSSFCYEKLVFDTVSGIEKASVAAIQQDASGRIWFAAIEQGIFVYDLQKHTIHLASDAVRHATSMAYDADHRVFWATSTTQKVWCMTDDSIPIVISSRDLPFTPKPEIAGTIKCIKVAKDGTVWATAFRQGVFFLRPGATEWGVWKPLLYESLDQFVIDKWDRIIIPVTAKGIHILSPETETSQFIPYTPQDPLGYNVREPNTPFVSRNGDLWVGGFPNGADVSYRTAITTHQITPKIQGVPINSYFPILNILKDSDGEVWVGTDGLGVYKCDTETNVNSPFKLGPEKREVIKTIYQDQKGDIWFGHWEKGMTRYNKKTNTFTYFQVQENGGPYQITGNNVWAFQEDRDGNFWVSCLYDGLVRFSKNGTERKVYFIPDKNVSPYKILDLYCDSKGTLWACFENHGLAYLKKGEEDFHFIDPDHSGLNDINIRCVFEDSKGNLWFGTEVNGLYIYYDNHFKRYSKKDGLLSSNVQAILEDKEGNIWLSSSIGLTRVTFNKGNLSCITIKEPAASNRFNHLAAVELPDNSLFFGGSNGLFKVIFNNTATNKLPVPHVLIANIRTSFNTSDPDDVNLLSQAYQGGAIRPPTNISTILIDFGCSIFGELGNTEYQYWLEGNSQESSTLKNGERRAIFTNLEAGDYVLHVKCKTGSSEWSEAYNLKITISMPFWKTRLFYQLLTIFIVTLIVLIGFMRDNNLKNKLKKQELEKETIRLQLEKLELTEEVEDKNIELLAKSAEMAQKAERLSEMKDLLSNLNRGTEFERSTNLRKLSKTLEAELKGEEAWEDFKVYFDKNNQNLSKTIAAEYPQLTINDLRMCMLIRLKMGTKEIAQMMNISVMGVQKNKYRLKKRLGLKEEDDLNAFIQNYSPHSEN